jgi:hypothetical protein
MKYELKLRLVALAAVLCGIAWAVTDSLAVGLAVFALTLVPAYIAFYIPYAKDNPQKLWFKRKLFGWGWTPVTWQGWLVTLTYALLVFLCALTIDQHSSMREVALTFILPVIILTSIFIRIALKKGEPLSWQWGRREEKKD